MRNLKSTLVFLFVLVYVLLLFGCSKTTENNSYIKLTPTPVPTQETLGIIIEPQNTQIPTPSPTRASDDSKNKATAKPQKNIIVFDEGAKSSVEVDKKSDDTPVQDEKNYCSLTINCETILNNMDKLKEEKHRLLPDNGIILSKDKIEFKDGESAFNVLRRELKREKIHMEFVDTPLYNSVYIEGINNIYEFDCGGESGWIYYINDSVPNYGISWHILKNGDKIRLYYVCNRSEDVIF